MPALTDRPAVAATTLDRSDESATTALYRAAIGPVNTDYYLSVFGRFDTANRAGPSWNWAACLSTLNWMAFRQLWGSALVYGAMVAGLALVILGLGRLVLSFSETTTLCLLVALATLGFLVPGFFGNALLFALSRNRMARAVASTSTVPEACVLLTRQSSTRQRVAWLALGNAALAGAATAFYMALPRTALPATVAYQPGDERRPAARPAAEPAPKAAPAASATIATPSPPASAATVLAPPMPMPAPVSASVSASAPTAAASAAANPASRASEPAAADAYPERRLTASAPEPGIRADTRPPATSTTQPTAPMSPTSATAPPPPAATTPRYYVNVGLFAQDSNARKAHAKLRAAGLDVFTQELDTPAGKRTRVRVGPFDTRPQADAAAENIRALELDAVVFPQ